jgi:polar amino acid transport system permease protein
VEILRGTSLLVQLFILFYVLPAIGVRLGPVETGIVGLGLNFGAYGSEIVRGAVLAVDQGQRDAAIALNLSSFVTMRRVILPQAVVAMLPPFVNSAIELLKATALTSLITVHELASAGNVLVLNTNRTAEVLTLVLLLYFLAAYPLSWLGRRLERRSSTGLNIGRMPT